MKWLQRVYCIEYGVIDKFVESITLMGAQVAILNHAITPSPSIESRFHAAKFGLSRSRNEFCALLGRGGGGRWLSHELVGLGASYCVGTICNDQRSLLITAGGLGAL